MDYNFWKYLGKQKKDKYNHIFYKCRCKCGIEKYVKKYNLEHNLSKGCKSCTSRKHDIIGRTFGRLKVIKYLKNKKSLCECICGKEKIALTGNLLSGNLKSCGCNRGIRRLTYDNDIKIKLLKNIKKRKNGCWEWQLSKHRQGYGNIMYKGKACLAHRISYHVFKGNVPINMLVCHKCDNPSCINPEHLFLGTQSDNVKDMYNKNRRNNIHK